MTITNSRITDNPPPPDSLFSYDAQKQRILEEMNRLGNINSVLWKIFFVCMTPGILNGLHVSSYVFLGEPPTNLTCVIPALKQADWSLDEIHDISTSGISNRCNIRQWDYDYLSRLNFSAASEYIAEMKLPAEIPCLDVNQNYFFYDNIGFSIVPEWNLVCDREVLRTTVQVALSIGKFAGAFLFGIVADKYGRKTSVTISSVLYIICGPLAAVSQAYWLFVMARIGLGVAGSGVYHSSYTILTEFAAPKHRSSLSIFFSVSYPIGMALLALAAYLVHPWRALQWTISLPALLLIVHYFFQKESPLWLVSKGRLNEAHRIVFGKSMDAEYLHLAIEPQKEPRAQGSRMETQPSAWTKMCRSVNDSLFELRGLYCNPKHLGRLLICHFTFFVTSLTYYVIALNGSNFLANQYTYVAVTGLTEVPSYIVPCIMFRFMGRKMVSLTLFLVSGVALLSILLIPQENTDTVIGVALFGRTCISAVFAVVILHTAELFPTNLRSSAIGTSSTMAHVGSISAPYIADLLGVIRWYIPTTICGATAIMAGLLVLWLPETENVSLDEEVD